MSNDNPTTTRGSSVTLAPADEPSSSFTPASVSDAVGGRTSDDGMPVIEGYKILSCLGAGGMGTVWRAVQLSTRREVALKLMSVNTARSPSACARFDREVELAARLEHPNVARVYDSGLHQGIYFYAMELIDGQPLDLHVAAQRLSRIQILDLMRAVCLAVQHAHQRGVIHRDLKPSNILVAKDGQPYVVDFGLAKALLHGEDASDDGVAGVAHPVSVEGDIAGTPQYMSPEQAAGKVAEIDTRSDVYSLGVILYQLLIGSTPHESSGTTYQVMRRIVEEEVRRPRSITRTIDRELEAILLKALARKPDQRYASAGELAVDIGNYLNGEPLTAKRPTLSYFAMKRVRKHKALFTSAGFVALALSAFVGWRYLRPATVELRTNPTGAEVYVDGIKQSCCTPTTVALAHGWHDVRFKPPTGYVEQKRNVGVRWGEASGLDPIVFAPNFQAVLFDTIPRQCHVRVTRIGSSEVVADLEDPRYIQRLPVGFYRVEFSADGYAARAETLNVSGSAEPFLLKVELVAADRNPAPTSPQ